MLYVKLPEKDIMTWYTLLMYWIKSAEVIIGRRMKTTWWSTSSLIYLALAIAIIGFILKWELGCLLIFDYCILAVNNQWRGFDAY